MESDTRLVEVDLGNGTSAYIRAVVLNAEQEVDFHLPSFDRVMAAVEGIAMSAVKVLDKLKPTKLAVEFGIEVGIESGELTALIAKGTGTADLKISLEWDGVDSERENR